MAKAKDFFSTAGGFVASMLGGGGLTQSADNSQGKVAAKLLTKSPLEIPTPLNKKLKTPPVNISAELESNNVTLSNLFTVIVINGNLTNGPSPNL